MSDNKKESDDLGKTYREIGPYLGLGIQLAITVAGMTFLGVWLDGEYDSSPWLTIVCAFLGVFAALYNFIKQVIKSGK